MDNQLSIIEYSYYYGLNNGNKSYVVPWIYTLDEKVDIDKLRKAINEALKFFPRYNAKPIIKKDGNIVLVDNDANPCINEDANNVYLGTKDSNKFLYRVIVENNKIIFSIAHSLGDGYGMTAFCENVLHYYYILKGEKLTIAKKIYTSSDIENESYKKSLIDTVNSQYDLTLDDENSINSEIFKSKNNQKEKFNLKLDDSLFAEKSFYKESIDFDAKSYIEEVHKYNATPITFLYMLLSQILIDKYSINNKNVTAGIAVDMRKYLNSRSQNNFGTLAFISYDTEWIKLPIDMQLKFVKEKLDKYIDIKWLKYMCKFFATTGGTSIDKYNINNYDNLMKELKNGYKYTSGGIFITNVGLINLSETLSKHVLDFEMITTPTKNDYEIGMTTYKNKGSFDLYLNGIDDGIFSLLCDKLNSFNINAKYKNRKIVENDHINPLLFDRE